MSPVQQQAKEAYDFAYKLGGSKVATAFAGLMCLHTRGDDDKVEEIIRFMTPLVNESENAEADEFPELLEDDADGE